MESAHKSKVIRGLGTDKQASAEHKAVVEFLRGKNGPKVRRGVLNGKRVDYFKGEFRSDS